MTNAKTADNRADKDAAADESRHPDSAGAGWQGDIVEWKTGPIKQSVDDFAGDGCQCGCGEN